MYFLGGGHIKEGTCLLRSWMLQVRACLTILRRALAFRALLVLRWLPSAPPPPPSEQAPWSAGCPPRHWTGGQELHCSRQPLVPARFEPPTPGTGDSLAAKVLDAGALWKAGGQGGRSRRPSPTTSGRVHANFRAGGMSATGRRSPFKWSMRQHSL